MAWIDRPAYLSRIVPFQNKPRIKILHRHATRRQEQSPSIAH